MMLKINGEPSEMFYCQKYQSWQPIESEMNCCEQVKEAELIERFTLPAFVGGFTFNEPTVFALTVFGIGLGSIVLEVILRDTNYGETARNFRERYVKYVYPICVVATGVWVFAKIVKILL